MKFCEATISSLRASRLSTRLSWPGPASSRAATAPTNPLPKNRPCFDDCSARTRSRSSTTTDAESRRFLQATSDLLRGLRGIDGRKTVVAVLRRFLWHNVSRELEDVARAAAETYSVIYAFDLNRRDRPPYSRLRRPSTIRMEIDNRLVPLGSLAIETSGALVKDASVRLNATVRPRSCPTTEVIT